MMFCKRISSGSVKIPEKLSYFRNSSSSTLNALNVKEDRSAGDKSQSNLSQSRPKDFLEIPGPTLHPILRILKNFAPIIGKYGVENQNLYLQDLLKIYGKIVRETISKNLHAVHIFDPKEMEKVFRNEGAIPHRIEMASLLQFRRTRPDLFTSPGVLTINGEEWYNLRQKIQTPLMRPQTVALYVPSVDHVADDFIARLTSIRDTKFECPDFLQELYKFAAETIAFILFRERLGVFSDKGSDEAKKTIGAVQDGLTAMSKLETSLQLFRYFRTPNYRKLERSQETIAKIAAKYIERTMRKLEEIPEDSDERRMILAQFLYQKDLQFGDIVVTINDLMTAGVDTTSHAIGMLLYNLAKNPKKQDKLAKEIKEVFPDVGCPITAADLQRLHYLRACLKESLRLFPIVDANVRTLKDDIELSGYNVPAGTLIVMNWGIAGKYMNYYESQGLFQPERFLHSRDKSESKTSPFTTLPFSYGSRSCVGRRLAELEIYVLVAKIIRRFRIEYQYEDIKMRSRLLNFPDRPLKLTFLDREN